MATWYKSQSHNNTFLAWLGMTPAGIHGRGMKEDSKQLWGVFCHFFPSGEVLSSVCAIWFLSRLKDETFSLRWHDCDLKSDILLPQNTFQLVPFMRYATEKRFILGEKQEKSHKCSVYRCQRTLSKPSALHGRGSGMFYLTVRCRGGGMAAGFPAVIDIFSSFEGRKGNSSAWPEGEKGSNGEV